MGSLLGREEELDTQLIHLPAPGDRRRCPGRASQLLAQRKALAKRGLQAGNSIVVVADIAAPYNLVQEQRGELVKVDEDGDAYIRFYGDEELWMHKSVLHLLSAEIESLSFGEQLAQLCSGALLALCLGRVLLSFPEAVKAVAFADQDEGSLLQSAWPLLISFLALPFFDVPQVRSLLYSFPDIAAFCGPALLSVSALTSNASARLVLISLSLLAFALSGLEEMNFRSSALSRQRDGWAYLIGWPLVLVPGHLLRQADLPLGLAAAAASVFLSCRAQESESLLRQHRAQASSSPLAAPRGSKALWPPKAKITALDSLFVGCLGGGLLILHGLFFTSVKAPAVAAFAEPTTTDSMFSWLALWLGLLAVLAPVPSSWHREPAVVFVVSLLPLVASLLQVVACTEAPGAGPGPFWALNLLLGAFPSLVALFVRRFSEVARSHAGGTALFVALAMWTSTIAMQLAPLRGDWAHAVTLKAWPLALLASFGWLLGVLGGSAEESEARAGVRPDLFGCAGAPLIAVAAFGCCAACFLDGAAQVESLQRSTLVIGEIGVHQGAMSACGLKTLRAADLIGLQSHAGPADVGALYSQALGLLRYSGTAGAASFDDRALLSSVTLRNVTANVREVGSASHASWVRASLRWQGADVQYYSVTVHASGNVSAQIAGLAEMLRSQEGPAIVAGTFQLPQNRFTRPADTALREMVRGTGLRDAFGALAPDASLPLPATFLPGLLPIDYVFYRSLQLVDARVDASLDCEDHLPLIVSFRLNSDVISDPEASGPPRAEPAEFEPFRTLNPKP